MSVPGRDRHHYHDVDDHRHHDNDIHRSEHENDEDDQAVRMVRMVIYKEKKRYLAAVWNGVSPYWGGERIICKEHFVTCVYTFMLLHKATCVKTLIFR